MGPYGAKLSDGPIVLRLPEAQPDNLTSEAPTQRSGFQGYADPPKRRSSKEASYSDVRPLDSNITGHNRSKN